VFRSRRRDVVFPQREHARFSAAIAGAWSDAFAPVPLPREQFVRGVAAHDRGYDEHDADEIGNLTPARWLQLQERGFAPTGEDAVVDLVVALHVRRLVSSARDTESRRLLEAMDEQLPDLVRTARVTDDEARAADRITNLCDRISFDLCLEQPDTGTVAVLGSDGAPRDVEYAVDGHGTVRVDPWPLEVDRLTGTIEGFVAAGYPEELRPVPTPFVVEPGGGR
jgi:hypothetical protein